MGRSISNSLKNRLQAQASECNTLGLSKIASSLDKLSETETRDNNEFYSYSHDEMLSDVEDLLWKAAVRVQDFYNKTADARDINDVVEGQAAELVNVIRHKIGGMIVGAYEPSVPGEQRADLEVTEND